jgi:hypothetical protein
MKFTVENRDVIRAYDFKPMVGREDCYIEGEVIDRNNTELGFQAYKVVVTKDSWVDEKDPSDKGRVGIEMFVPWEVAYNDYQGRVINLSRI